jgi:hypothetical protein
MSLAHHTAYQLFQCSSPYLHPYLWGVAAVLLYLALASVAWGKHKRFRFLNPLNAAVGADGRPSTSKFQFFVWTGVVLWAYVAIVAARWPLTGPDPIQQVPRNVLIALGLSAGTLALAKGVTVGYLAANRISKADPAAAITAAPHGVTGADAGRLAEDAKTLNQSGRNVARGIAGLVTDDEGYPELSKIQMLCWTAVAVVVYVGLTLREVHAGQPYDLPDIDPMLMILMGLADGAYIGKKLVTADTARLTGLSVGGGKPGDAVSIIGAGFGDAQAGSLITLDGHPISAPATAWGDALVTFKVPEKHPLGTEWPAGGQRVLIGLIVNGKESANSLPFTVKT